MKIKFNEVTWYSKLLAVVVFLATFFIAYSLGVQYGQVQQADWDAQSSLYKSMIAGTTLYGPVVSKAIFACDSSKMVAASFYKKAVSLGLTDGRTMIVPQTISASGARYANTGETFVFWNKGNTAFIEEGPQASSGAASAMTYKNCVAR